MTQQRTRILAKPNRNRGSSQQERGAAVLVLLAIVVLIGIFFVVRAFRSTPPEIVLNTDRKGLGRSTLVSFTINDRRGLSSLAVTLEQNGQHFPVIAEDFASRWSPNSLWRPGPKTETRQVMLGTGEQQQLKDGQATLHIVAVNTNWFSSRATLDRTFSVRSRPPSISIQTSGVMYINQAGSEMALYAVSPGTVTSGVRVGSYFFPGYPMPGGQPDDRIAFFAFPFDAPVTAIPTVIAKDDADNEAQATFPYKLFEKRFRRRDIAIDDAFMQATVPAILSHSPEVKDQGDLLKNFVLVNNEVRKANRARIAELGRDTVAEFLWEGPFLQLSNSAVESQFADFRSYMYKGQKVDEQVHLGFDLASVIHAPVVAANSGRVIFAEYLGIFGNTIIIDHGFGLQTIYAHLNSFKVKPGDRVAKNQVIADSDSTGLAGGDHLHFTTLISGVEVNPVEWWDKLWIDRHLMDRLAAYRKATSPASLQ